jgi:hypothetical protein
MKGKSGFILAGSLRSFGPPTSIPHLGFEFIEVLDQRKA